MKRRREAGSSVSSGLTYHHHVFEQNEAVLLLWPVLMFIFHVITALISLFNRTYSKGGCMQAGLTACMQGA
eukprot:1085133-Pelagomonas_calceolata.AAC.5